MSKQQQKLTSLSLAKIEWPYFLLSITGLISMAGLLVEIGLGFSLISLSFLALIPVLLIASVLSVIADWKRKDDASKNTIDAKAKDKNDSQKATSSLYEAILEHNANKVKACLMDPRIELNIQNKFGTTDLHMAVNRDDLAVVNALLEDPRVDINIQDDFDNTALHTAIVKRSTNIVKALLAHSKLDPSIKNKGGESPLNFAVKNNC